MSEENGCELTPEQRAVLTRKERKTGLSRRLDPAAEKWWAQLIDRNGLNLDHVRVLSRHGKHQLDAQAIEMWAKLAKKEKLTADDLGESIRLGRVTKIEADRGGGEAGVPTWQGLSMQFKLCRRMIGDKWRYWTPDEVASLRARMAPIVEFYQELATLYGDGARLANIIGAQSQARAREASYQDLPEGLRAWRKRGSITQVRAAKVLQVPIGTYRDWEQGRRTPRGPAFWNIQRKIAK